MGNQACRKPLLEIATARAFSHPGLALSRYLTQNGDNREKAKDLLNRVAASQPSEVYKAAFARYRAALPKPVQLELELGGPLALGLGISSPLEVGLTTLHTYGMPVIPGSAIKGVCRDYAEQLLDPKSEQFLALIGSQEWAGLCIFYDAWYVPGSAAGDRPFHRDVVTVHHPGYYQGKGAWPTDFDDPNPVPFVVVKPGSRFLFALRPPAPEWADFVEKLLVHAMTKHGVGGKINAGYGWFKQPNAAGASPSGGQAAAAKEPTASEATWRNVKLTYDAGSQTVKCTSGDGTATAKIDALGLTEAQIQMLKKRRELPNVTVSVRLLGGRNYRIVKVTAQ